MTDSDFFALTYLPCPICKLRYYRGAAIWIAVRLCVVYKHCPYHCCCGPAQRLEELKSFEDIPAGVDLRGQLTPVKR
jgi:hypothetical protein